jgi:hypothetical protein
VTEDPAPEKDPFEILAENLHTEPMPERVPRKQEQAPACVTPLCDSLNVQPPVAGRVELPHIVVR